MPAVPGVRNTRSRPTTPAAPYPQPTLREQLQRGFRRPVRSASHADVGIIVVTLTSDPAARLSCKTTRQQQRRLDVGVVHRVERCVSHFSGRTEGEDARIVTRDVDAAEDLSACMARFATDWAEARSATTKSALPRAARMRATTSSPRRASRPVTRTWTPCDASASAIA